MWLLPLIAISIAIRLNGAKKYHLNEDSIPRYVIPHPEERQQSASLPEAVVKKSGSIVGTELPGAYGEDFELDPFESGSGISGSGSSGEKADVIFVARSGEDLETAGKFGNNDAPAPPNNPVTAFTNDEKEEEEDDEDVEAAQAVSKPKKQVSKTDTSAPTVKDATEKQAKTSKSEGAKKTMKVKKTEKTKKHKSSTKRTKAKAKSNVAPPSSDENNMISKIDAIARQIERVEHKEKLDRKEEATLKVAKKVAKKVIKDIAAKKQKAKIVKEVSNMIEKPAVQIAVQPAPTTAKKENAAAAEVKVKQVCPITNPYAYKGGSRCCHINQDKQGHPLSLASQSCDSDHDEECPTGRCTDNKSFVGPEGFECPWACFWSCHSYCPKECCHNPYKCDLVCREICTPYCSDRCCAPGSKRLPKLQITFPANEGNYSVFGNNQVGRTFNGTLEDNAENAKLNPAENSYQQEKVAEEKIEYERQMDVLKKAASLAASQIGLPSECPLACARICLPGLCKSECCRSSIPNAAQKYQLKMPLGPFSAAAVQPAASPIAAALPTRFLPPVQGVPNVLGPQPYSPGATNIAKAIVNPALNRLALAKKMTASQKTNPYLMQNKPQTAAATAASVAAAAAAAAYRRPPANNYALNKLALQNNLLQGKASVAQYRAMALANQMNSKNALLGNNLKSAAIANPAAAVAAVCRFPSPSCQNPFVPPLIHNCAPVCRTSCIPTCPNECCVI